MTTTTTDTESIGVLSGVDPVGRVTDSLPSRPFHTGRGHCCVSRYCGPPSAVRRRTLSRSGCSAVSAEHCLAVPSVMNYAARRLVVAVSPTAVFRKHCLAVPPVDDAVVAVVAVPSVADTDAVSRCCGRPSAVRRRTPSRCSVRHELCCATTSRCGVAHLSSVNTVLPATHRPAGRRHGPSSACSRAARSGRGPFCTGTRVPPVADVPASLPAAERTVSRATPAGVSRAVALVG